MAAKPFTAAPKVALKGDALVAEVKRVFPLPAHDARELRTVLATTVAGRNGSRSARRPGRKNGRARKNSRSLVA
jgi:hypothetical protein